jgi:diguanylate cyclase (GGDEF)-like protein
MSRSCRTTGDFRGLNSSAAAPIKLLMGPASHRSRPGAWSLAVLLPAFTALGAMAAGYVLDAAWAWDAAWTAAAVSAAAGMALGRACAAPSERERWTWWVAAAAAWLIGQLAWDLFGVIGSPASPNVADFGWWAFAVLVIFGLIRLPTAPSRAVRVVALVEALPLIFAAVALTFAQLWPAVDASPLDLAPRLSALLYPAFYVSAAIVTLQAMIGGSLRHVDGPGPRLVLAGIVGQAVAFILWSKQLLDGHYVLGHTIDDPLWLAGLVAIGAGGLLAARAGGDGAARQEHQDTTPWGGVLPAGVFLLLIAALVKAQLAGSSVGARLTLATGLLFCGATLVARGTLLEIRLRALLARERGANERLLEDSRRDALTGLRNRRALTEDLAALESLTAMRGGSFAVLLCDVDCFKAYNDHAGHLAGDRALRAIAAAARAQLRNGDAAYRYGGEELLVLLHGADAAAAMAAAEGIRIAVSRAGIAHPAGVAPVLTVSIGVAAGTGDAAAVLARADAALYAAKDAGRNRVMASSGVPPAEAGSPHRPPPGAEDPASRQLRGILAVARAGAWAGEPATVLEALAGFIRAELHYQTVAVNLRDRSGTRLEVVHVLGDEDVRAALLGTASAIGEWERLLDRSRHPSGAVWLPKGAYEWDVDVAVWTPTGPGALEPDDWDPEDMLLLPLRDSAGELLAVVSVDEPLHGARPDDGELATLMAAAEHAALALEQVAARSGAQLAAR